MSKEEQISGSDIRQILKDASKFRRFPVTEKDLKDFLQLIYEKQPIDLWDYVRVSEQYIRVIMSLLYRLEKGKYLSVDKKGKLRLTEKGAKLAKGFSVKKTMPALTKKGYKFGLELTPKFRKILKEIEVIAKYVIPQNRYDQAPLVPEAAVYKAAYAVYRGDVTNKNVVCVGDDDLTSIIFTLSGAPKKVLAIDIDKYLLETIEEYAEKKGYDIETLNHDLRKPIPAEYRNKYEFFITEPPDTVTGISLFVSRGVELLKKEQDMVGYCGISVTPCPPLGLKKIQENFNDMGLLITDRLPKYSDYPPHRTELKHVEVPDCYDKFYPPKKIWYVADLLRVKTTAKTKPLYRGNLMANIANYNQDAMKFK